MTKKIDTSAVCHQQIAYDVNLGAVPLFVLCVNILQILIVQKIIRHQKILNN